MLYNLIEYIINFLRASFNVYILELYFKAKVEITRNKRVQLVDIENKSLH